MIRLAPYLACVAGIIVIVFLMPRFNAAQPKDIRLTRSDAVPIADKAAQALGIPVAKAWKTLAWENSSLLDKQLERTPELRRKAADDPVLGPRLAGYRRTYYRRGLEKNPSYGEVVVDPRTGAVGGGRRRRRGEDSGGKPTEAQLRPRADAFVRARAFPGAPDPVFESARPTSYRGRTDWTFRYRVKTSFPIGNVVPYLNIYYTGDQFAGWGLVEEYADGSAYRYDSTGIGEILVRYATNFALLLILLIIFLKKYHAGEVGIGTGSVLLVVLAVLALAIDSIIGPSSTEGSSTGD